MAACSRAPQGPQGSEVQRQDAARNVDAVDPQDGNVADRGQSISVREPHRSQRRSYCGLAARKDPATTKAIDIGRTDLVSCDATATVAEVSQQMTESYVRHVLLADGGRVIGIVSARDLLGAYAAAEGAGA